MPASTTVPSAAHNDSNKKVDTSHLWNVRGKWYDLSSFQHPGGPLAIDIARGGSDADELVRSYHPFAEEKVRKILEKYEVKDIPVAATKSGVFDLEESQFDKELKQIVADYLKQNGNVRTANFKRWVEYIGLLTLAIISTVYFVKGWWLTILTTPLLWWTFGVSIFHDASHFAVSRYWWVNAICTYLFPYFSSPLTWYYQHIVGHHPFVNIRGKDPDLYHHSPLHRYTTWHRFKPMHAYQLYTVWIIWCLGTSIQSFVTDFVFIKKNVYQHVVVAAPISRRRKIIHFAGRFATFAIMYVWPFFVFNFAKAMVWAFLPYFLFSVCYLSISQVGHVIHDTMTPANSDFYKHQIQHTHNFGTKSLWCFYLSGGLNMQIEHHLFPGLNHWHLFKIAPKVRALCKKHNVDYNESSGYLEAVRKHLSVLQTTSHP